jgi:alkanesulfonate monooxygenase SsuD/methylene tetrahydromethanopterin reductase-like flavin-dependent oxidoreductase (luciferase family)
MYSAIESRESETTLKSPMAEGSAGFGILITSLHEPQDNLGERLREHREQVRLARDTGFSSVAAGQHFLTHPTQMVAPIPHLASVAEDSGDMRLVLGVLLLPLLHPVLVAEEVASIDWLSNGRVTLGLGIGYRPEELDAMSVSPRDRVTRFNESLEVVKRVWSADDKWSFEGRHYHFTEMPGGLKPLQKPHPPLWVASDVDAAVRRAGRLGAAWYINPRATLTSLKRQLEIYKESLEKHNHKMPDVFPIRREAFVADTDQEARKMAVQYLKRMLATYESWGQYEVMPGADIRERTFSEADIPDTYLVGSPEHVAELIHRYIEELSVNQFMLRMHWPGMSNSLVMKSMELVGARLIPMFS